MMEWIISSSVLIAAVWAGRALLKGKISLRLQYGLWALVLVRLLVPVSLFDSPISVQNVVEQQEIPRIYEDSYVRIPVRDYETAYEQVVQRYEAEGVEITPSREPMIQKEAHRQMNLNLSLDQIVKAVWLGGMAVMGIGLVASNAHFYLRLRRSRKKLEAVWVPVKIYTTGAVRTPCLYGVFRPAIYVTPEVAADEKTLKYVLNHEVTHFRHFDHIWAALRSLCLVLHWYNPLVWVAAKLSCQDCEMACDEGTLMLLGEENRGDYGRTLVDLTCHAGHPSLLISATTMTGGKREMKERIVLLMKHPKTALITAIAVALCGAILIGCTFTGAGGTTEPDATTPAETTAPVETEPVDTTPQVEAALPWTPGEGIHMNYKAYFKQVRNYDFNKGNLYFGRSWGKYSVLYQDNTLVVVDGMPDDIVHTVPNADMSVEWVACDSNWIYGVRNGTELIRIDYWGENEEVLFNDGVHAINVDTGWMYVAEETVLVFAACSNRGSIICRVFLPDMTVDIMAESDAAKISLSDVPSNHEVAWYERNPEFDELVDGMTAEELEKYGSDADQRDRISKDHLIPMGYDHYVNMATGEHRTLDYYGVYYSERHGQAIYINRDRWWLDSMTYVTQKYSVPKGAVKLTTEQIEQINEAFHYNNYDEAAREYKNPITNFYLGTYSSIEEMDINLVVKYFCCQTIPGTEEDIELLSAKYPKISYFNNLTRYPADVVDKMYVRYTGHHIEEIYGTRDVDSVLYLEETDSYYSIASDAGWGEFVCTEGYIDGDIVVLRSKELPVYVTFLDGKRKWMVTDTLLTLRLSQEDGRYYIVSHLPLEAE